MEIKNLKEEIVIWNIQFPVDKWWRDKHKVPFMSKLHRDCSFIDQLFEYEEERMFREMSQSKQDNYIPNIGEYLNIDESNFEAMSRFAADELKSLNGNG